MKTREPWNTIHNFFGAYFHQDWPEECGSVLGVMEDYLKGHDVEQIRNLAEDIEEYLREHPDDAELERLLFDDLGCYYDPASGGFSARQWMTWVVSTLQREADRRPTPPV